MDKEKKKKLVPAVCFILVCGVVSLGIHYGRQRKEQIVLEKQDDTILMQETALPYSGETEVDDGTETIPEKTLCVHICGAVEREGVYTLPDGSRLTDGIAAAGGFLESADKTYHNLAAYLKDGQKVYVPTTEETRDISATERMDSSATKDGEERKVNLNTADSEELMTLSGIGEAKAESILQYREKVGLFQSIEELKKVSGIGDAMFERVREQITVE